MAMEENIIKFKDVSFQYQSDTAFTLDHVSFNIPKGKWTTIVGHNGSGKSTLAKLMVGIEQANEGQIFIIITLSMHKIYKIFVNILVSYCKTQKTNLLGQLSNTMLLLLRKSFSTS